MTASAPAVQQALFALHGLEALVLTFDLDGLPALGALLFGFRPRGGECRWRWTYDYPKLLVVSRVEHVERGE